MKKYYICFFILAVLLTAAIFTGSYFFLFRPQAKPAVPNGIMESETVIEDNVVMNQSRVEKREMDAFQTGGEVKAAKKEITQTKEAVQEKQYYLVAEDGFLLVFAKDKDTVCLDTHMPLAEFPLQEQEKLIEGIWFSTMMEIFNYLESYSS